ncbi:hypothetical protein [Gordonia spumicola]|nr:hypothetical protein [Gordonia spumicola]
MATLTTPLLPLYRHNTVPNTPSTTVEVSALVDLAIARGARIVDRAPW